MMLLSIGRITEGATFSDAWLSFGRIGPGTRGGYLCVCIPKLKRMENGPKGGFFIPAFACVVSVWPFFIKCHRFSKLIAVASSDDPLVVERAPVEETP